jgi:hypothetical protein
MLLKLKPFLTAALLVVVGVWGARAWGACIGDEWVAGEWICEEEDGRLLLNSGGDGDWGNLMLTGGAGFSTNVPDVNGGCGHSLLFPGVDAAEAAVSTNNAYDPLAGAEKFTIMAWVRRDSAPGTNLSARIFSDADSVSPGANGVEFRFSGAEGKLALRINGTEVESAVATVPATNGVWHHVAVVWDGTRPATNLATRNAHFYVDGVQRGSGNVLQTVVASNAFPAVVGNASASRLLAYVLAGNVDDVLVLPGWAPDPSGNGNTNDAIRCFMDWNDDIFPPTITPSGNIERDAGSCLTPVALELATPLVWDNCGVAGVTNNAPAAFPVGLSTVTWTAWDEAGNTATAVQSVVVVPSHTADCDGDGLSDWDETMIHGSDYDNADTDGDGLPDGWEVRNGLSPVDSSGDDGADGDPDGDGFSNSLEYDLGAPANNRAWNGAELAYRLTHATPVVTTNNRSVTTNWVGLRVDVEDSQDCNPPDGNSGRQNVVTNLQIPDLLECGYYVKVGIAGSVENVDSGYDKVYFNAATNVKYFSSHDGIPDELGYEWCEMVSESAVKTNLVLANSTVSLRYDTVSYKWHSGAYAQIVSASEVAPYAVTIAGPDFLCVGDTGTLSASGAGGGPYTWEITGDAIDFDPSTGVVTAITAGVATVTATAPGIGHCVGLKTIAVLSLQLDQIREQDAPCNRAPNPKQTTPSRLFVCADESEQVKIDVCATILPYELKQHVLCAAFDGSTRLACARFGSDGIAGLSFTPATATQTAQIRLGLDDNGNGELDLDEVRTSGTSLDLMAFSGNHYTAQRNDLDSRATWAKLVNFDVGASLLIRFLGREDPPLPFGATSYAAINCFFQNNLTHNAGAEFNILGNGVLELNTWMGTGTAGVNIAESDELATIITSVLDDHSLEVQSYFAAHPDENTYSAVWFLHDINMNFAEDSPFPNMTEYDLHVAFGHANISDLTVRVGVTRWPLGNLVVESLDVYGELDDLYDFDHEAGGMNSAGAVLQIGWSPHDEGRKAGNIFFDRVYFERSFSIWNYNF